MELTIVTDYSRTIDYEFFLYIDVALIELEGGDTIYSIIGITNEEGEYIALCSEDSAEEIVEQHNRLLLAIKYGERIVDYRKSEPIDAITILNNTQGKPGSDLN